jgi:hypothetical protein
MTGVRGWGVAPCPFPPAGLFRQTIQTRNDTPWGGTLIRYRRVRCPPISYPVRSPVSGETLVYRSVPRPTTVERPGRPGTPVPIPLLVPSSARQRLSHLRCSGTGGCLVRPVRLVARRLLIVPSSLDTLCRWPNRQFRPLKVGPSVVAVLPEHNSGALPGSRSTL